MPAALGEQPERAAGVTQGTQVCYDPDGRRRITWSDEVRRQTDRLIRQLAATGQAFFLACRNEKARPDGKPACGEMMAPEGRGGPDEGYGCKCTRIHFEFRGRR